MSCGIPETAPAGETRRRETRYVSKAGRGARPDLGELSLVLVKCRTIGESRRAGTRASGAARMLVVRLLYRVIVRAPYPRKDLALHFFCAACRRFSIRDSRATSRNRIAFWEYTPFLSRFSLAELFLETFPPSLSLRAIAYALSCARRQPRAQVGAVGI